LENQTKLNEQMKQQALLAALSRVDPGDDEVLNMTINFLSNPFRLSVNRIFRMRQQQLQAVFLP
jgi:hypothetical protein